LNRVGGCFEDGRDIRGRGLCRKRRSGSQRGNHGHLTTNQIVRQGGQPVLLIPGKAIFDRNILILYKARLLEPLTKGGHKLRRVAGRARAQETDHRHRTPAARLPRAATPPPHRRGA
jgi:hypothetical protein